jgi:hypothetical protein
MTKRLLVFLVLAPALACGGSDNSDPGPEPWSPPVVDPTRLGVACPAPEVPIMLYAAHVIDYVPAGDLEVGDMVYGLVDPFSWPVSDATLVPGQQRLRLVLGDGRAPVFTPDHVLRVTSCPGGDVVPIPDELRAAGGYIEVQFLVPGVCLDGTQPGRVQDIEEWPEGDVVRISVNTMGGNAGAMYVADGLFSLAHPAPLQ